MEVSNATIIDNPPFINHTSPPNTTNISLDYQEFNCYIEDDSGLTNVSFYINDTLNQTNSSPVNATSSPFFVPDIPDETIWNWSCTVFDNATIPQRDRKSVV